MKGSRSQFLLFSALTLSSCAGSAVEQARLPFHLNVKPNDASHVLEWSVVEVEGQAEAASVARDRRQMVASLVAPKIDPYTGNDSTPAPCQTSLLPPQIFKEGKNGEFKSSAFGFYSSDRRVLGLCLSADRIIKTQYQLLYCGEKALYALKYFYPATDAWLKEEVAHCQ